MNEFVRVYNATATKCNYELFCPHCGSENLHQEKIEIFNRDEDEKTGLHLRVVGKTAVVDQNMGNNPSPRRQGMTLSFYCEECSDNYDDDGKRNNITLYTLAIYQHKGVTMMEWLNK